MVNTIGVLFGFVVIGLVLLAVLGAVERREKYLFVAGVALVLLGPGTVASLDAPVTAGGVLAVVGFLACLGSTVPLLAQSPTTA